MVNDKDRDEENVYYSDILEESIDEIEEEIDGDGMSSAEGGFLHGYLDSYIEG